MKLLPLWREQTSFVDRGIIGTQGLAVHFHLHRDRGCRAKRGIRVKTPPAKLVQPTALALS